VADPARHRPNAAAADPVAAGTRARAGMILQLDPDSPVPPYEQLRSQITTMVATGVLPQGARLPPIRQLARDLGVATATIARVFRELERDQIITTRGRHGTFILDAPAQAAAAERDQRLAAAAHSFAVQARQLGIDPEQALRQARQALEALVPRAGHA
jgi:DNA-binding transcriptional regulator YhcF (GntR family)